MLKLIVIVILALIGGCTSSLPIIQTGTPQEYVVVARNMASVFSSLEVAQNEAVTKAMAYCMGMGRVYVKKYAIDRPMAVGQVPESSLYFTCTVKDDSVTNQTTASEPSTTMKKMEELNIMLSKGLITQDEYNTKKQEILKKM